MASVQYQRVGEYAAHANLQEELRTPYIVKRGSILHMYDYRACHCCISGLKTYILHVSASNPCQLLMRMLNVQDVYPPY